MNDPLTQAPLLEPQLLRQREPDADRRAALDLPFGALRVDHPAGVLCNCDLDDARDAELLVDVDDRTLGDEGEAGVDVTVAVPVEAGRRPVVVRRRPRDRFEPVSIPTSSPSGRLASSAALISRQAASTAPPAIVVWRDAEVEPADPIVAVSAGRTATRSTPSSVRTICASTVYSPWP